MRSKANAFDLWAVGVTVVLGGQLIGWNSGLFVGFGTFAIAQGLMAFSYICLMFCLAEITSMISFSGGAYGLARVVLGFYVGFLVGYFELLEFTMYSSATIFYISIRICETFALNFWFQPLFWIIFYSACLFAVHCEGRFFWNLNIFFAVSCIILVLIYSCGSMQWIDFSKNASLHRNNDSESASNWFAGGMYDFIKILPVTTWAYGGVESLSFTASEAINPKKNLPIGMITSVLTLFLLNVLIVFVASSLPPGIISLVEVDFPMNYGYNKLFNCKDFVSSMLVIPGQFAMAFGFMLPYGKLLQSLANSNLVPSVFCLKDNKTPHKAIVIATLISFLFCCIALSHPLISDSMNNIAILAEFFTNISTLLGFIMMRLKYSSITRGFHSPFGVIGAVVSLIIFLLGSISVVGNFQDDYDISFVCVLLIAGLLSVFYFFVAEKTQKFSKDEEQSLLKLHVINININKRRSSLVYKAAIQLKKFIKLIKLKKLETFSIKIVKNNDHECICSSFELNSVKYKNHDNDNSNNIDVKKNNKSSSFCKKSSNLNETLKNSLQKEEEKEETEKEEIEFFQINDNNINEYDSEGIENENTILTNEKKFIGSLIRKKTINNLKRKILNNNFLSSSKIHPLPI
jgi:amino acid transporter